MEGRDVGRTIELLFGVALVVLGGLFALAELAGGQAWGLVWPLFVVVPGVLFYAAIPAFGKRSGFLAIPGSILTVSGLVLLATNTFGVWAAWSYAWTLVTPASVGLGLWIYGVYDGIPSLRRTGDWLMFGGLVAFALLGSVFELIIGVSGPAGREIGRFAWPLLLVVLGLVMVFATLRRRS